MYYLTRQTAFEASHYNRILGLSDAENFKLFGAAANPNSHGHNYVLEVMVKGCVDVDDGMVINLVTLDAVLKTEVLANYDHKHLNRQHPVFAKNPHLQPTCENITIEIWQRLVSSLPDGMLHRVRLYESATDFADYYGEGPMFILRKSTNLAQPTVCTATRSVMKRTGIFSESAIIRLGMGITMFLKLPSKAA